MPVVKGERAARPTATPIATPVVAPPVQPASPGAIKTAAEPRAPEQLAPKLEKPVPALQQHNFQGGINQFNERVQSVHDSYTAAYGVAPSPGLTFDLATSKVDVKDFQRMFTVPQSQFAAKNRGTLTAKGIHTIPDAAYSARDIADQIIKAAAQGDYHSFVEQNIDTIHDLSSAHKDDAATIAGAIFKARRLETFRNVETKVNNGDLTPGQGREQLQAMGMIPGGSAFHALKGAGGVIALGIGQIADSLVHSPAGLYELGKAAGLDTRDIVLHPTSSQHFSRTAPIGKAVGTGIVRDVSDPAENPGYLFLDILGFAAPVVGAGARAAEAGRVLRAGEGVGAAGKALARKPPLRRVTLRHGDITEEMPLSQNPAVALVQEVFVKGRQAGADARLAGDSPSALRSVLLPQIAQEFLDKNLSFETKIGREADARKRIDHIVATTLSRELDHVAGRAITQARIQSAVPSKVRGSLTRGEQKAIQVQSWDDPNPLAAERSFHERMIEMGVGDPKAHRTQLADLKLAEKALANPSPRLVKALELTRRVVADMEEIKIRDLGLLPETAEGRIAKAGAVLRGEDITRVKGEGGQFKELRTTDKSKVVDVVPLERTNPDSFYLPTQSRGKVKRPPSDRAGYFPVKAGPFGIPPGRALPELTHEFTGKAIQAGDFRIDATSLATEAYGRTVRAATVRSEHAKLWDSASKTPYGKYSVPIRDVNQIPDKLREVIARLDEGDFGPKDAAILPADMRHLIEALYPDHRTLTADEIEHVRWIDARLLGEGNSMPHIPGLAAKVAQGFQAPVRFTTLYLRPAYILNKLGNHAMLLFDQGWMAIPNYAKALTMDERYGGEATRTIHELVGAGKSTSYVTGSSGKVSRAVAEFWNKIADRGERATSFIYYMERKGYKTKEQVNDLIFNPANRADLVEITRRANKALVEFDNLLPIEKNYIRHFVFVYPWVSRSAVWSIRAALEHPTQTDALMQLGRQELDSDPIFKLAPAWFKRVGYIPVGWNHDGTPKVINPTSVNTFSTLGDFVSFAKASTVGDKYASAEDFLGPFPKFLIHGVTGRDEFGNKYPGSQWADAAKAVLVGLPQVSAYQRAGKAKAGTGKLPNVADRSSLETSLNASLRATVMSPGWLQGYGTLLAGGFSPRDASLPALAARYWADQDPKVRHGRELDLLNRALTIQGEVLKQDVPKAVRAAVADQANLDYEYKTFLKQNGRVPSDRERADFTITYLTKQGMLPKAKAAEWRKKLQPLADTSDISRLKNHLLDTYANGKALRAWDTDVRTVASFRKDVFNQKVAELHKQGLADQSVYQGSQDKLYDYGRKYLAFTREANRMQAAGAPTADLRAFQDKNDVPVNGLPSFVRMAWANQTPDQQQQAVTAAAARSWRDNTAFDKALLGRPSDAKVTAGWAKLQEIIDTQKASLKREGRSFPAGYARTLAQYVEKYYDASGLVKDYDFSKKSLADRLKYLTPVQKSPNRGEWTQLLTTAQTYAKWLDAKNADGSKTYSGLQVRQSWTDYIHGDGFQSWLGEHPEFKAELQAYGKSFLAGLI